MKGHGMYCGPPAKPKEGSREITFDGLRDISGPITKNFAMAGISYITSGLSRDGVVYREKEVLRYDVAYSWAVQTEMAFMNILEELRGNYEGAEQLWSAYRDKLKNFRNEIKNDVASLEASARKTVEAVQRMNKAYGDVIAQMNGIEMQQAILNAERLATAMSALANLQSHKLTVAVVDQSQPSGNGA